MKAIESYCFIRVFYKCNLVMNKGRALKVYSFFFTLNSFLS